MLNTIKKLLGGVTTMDAPQETLPVQSTVAAPAAEPAPAPSAFPAPPSSPAPAPAAPVAPPIIPPAGHEGLIEARPGEPEGLRGRIIDIVRTVFDPEIPVNIFELGLIYNIDITPEGVVNVRMTLTAPNCPAAGTLPGEVEAKIRGVAGVTGVKLELVWEPTWSMGNMSEAARLELGF